MAFLLSPIGVVPWKFVGLLQQPIACSASLRSSSFFPGVGTRCRKRTTPLLSEETRSGEAAAVSLHSAGRRAAPNILPKGVYRGQKGNKKRRSENGSCSTPSSHAKYSWSRCCCYLSAFMPATHNLFFPQGGAESVGAPWITTAADRGSIVRRAAPSLSPKAKTASRSDVSLWRP